MPGETLYYQASALAALVQPPQQTRVTRLHPDLLKPPLLSDDWTVGNSR